MRADHYIRSRYGLSRRETLLLFDHEAIRAPSGRPLKKADPVAGAESVVALSPEKIREIFENRLWERGLTPSRNPDKVKIVYQDDDLVVLHKPPFQHCFPQRSDENETLAQQLIAYDERLAKIGPPEAPSILHRLDHLTEGIVLAAKTQACFDKIRGLFSSHRVSKSYYALVEGEFGQDPQEICGHLINRYRNQKRVRLDVERVLKTPQTLPRQSFSQTIEPVAGFEGDGRSLLKITTRYGIRHQIRASLSKMGFPIVHDPLYGTTPTDAESNQPERTLALLAHTISSQKSFHFSLGLDPIEWAKGF